MDKIMQLRKYFLVGFILICAFAKGQKIENIFINLYTDSLKKGTYNYINVDGLLSNGKYIPLDSTQIIFWSTDGKFSGNNLWLDKNFYNDQVLIKVILRGNPKLTKEFTMFVKKKPDDEILKTEEEMLNGMKTKAKRKSKN